MQTFPAATSLRREIAPTLDLLRPYRVELDEIIVNWSHSLTSQQFVDPLIYRNTSGQIFSKNFGYLVLHFFNHQTHHRGQATTLLFQAGVDMGVTDLLAVIPSEA